MDANIKYYKFWGNIFDRWSPLLWCVRVCKLLLSWHFLKHWENTPSWKKIWPRNHAETFIFQTLYFSSMSLVPCTQAFKVVFATALAEILPRGTNLQQLNDSGGFSHFFTQNLLFVWVCVNELFRGKRDFSFTCLSCKVFVVNFRLKD